MPHKKAGEANPMRWTMFVRMKDCRGWAVRSGVLLSLCLAPSAIAYAQQPDNSGVNKGQEKTAESQSGHMSDREITAKIRRAVVGDKSLSTYGHNVKIITKSGGVTLKGPVHSEDEKKNIEQKAAEVAGQDKVTDQLTVKQ